MATKTTSPAENKDLDLGDMYTRSELFFEKNKNHGERDVHDRAGFWANVDRDAFLVVDVTAGAEDLNMVGQRGVGHEAHCSRPRERILSKEF